MSAPYLWYRIERRVRGSNPHGLSTITVFETDKHANHATLQVEAEGEGVEPSKPCGRTQLATGLRHRASTLRENAAR